MWSRRGIIFVISAPSGTGKTTICKHILEDVSNIRFSISYTTRSKRKGEIEGKDYYFVDRKKFIELAENNFFVEWAEVYGNFYGTPWSELSKAEKEGYDLLLEIDVQGGINIKKEFPSAVLIFVMPPSLDSLAERLKKRGRDSEEEINKRLKVAKSEMAFLKEYDYVVENIELHKAVRDIKCIIEAERLRKDRVAGKYIKDLDLEE